MCPRCSSKDIGLRVVNTEEELQESFAGRVRGMDIDHQMIVGLRKKVEAATAVLEVFPRRMGAAGWRQLMFR